MRSFVPGDTDITAERWRSSNGEVILELPCVAAVDNMRTTEALLSWVDDNFDYYARDMTSQGGDFLISATFREAIRFARMIPVCSPFPQESLLPTADREVWSRLL